MARQMAVSIMVQALIFGVLVPGIDNFAHLGGFAGGYFMSAFLKPMTPERGDHTIIAILCLVASALSILASLFVLFR
jgi:rhomboid protease GluP